MPALVWLNLDVLTTSLNHLRMEQRQSLLAGNIDRFLELNDDIDALIAERDRLMEELSERLTAEIADDQLAAA
jgi:hypothetical protein